jgi:hypothetical protein
MKRSTLLDAMGSAPMGPDEEVAEGEVMADEDDADPDAEIEAFLDPTADMSDRVASFRAAVQACMKGY